MKEKTFDGISLIGWIFILAVLCILILVPFFYFINKDDAPARRDDAQRYSDVEALYLAIQEWNKTQLAIGKTSYNLSPTEGNHWQQALIDAHALKSRITAPFNDRGSCTYIASSTNDSGYCVSNNGATPGEIVVWTIAESKLETVKAGGWCMIDPIHNFAVIRAASDRGGTVGLFCIGKDTSTPPEWKAAK